ncbi:MAG: hypothetical protein IJX90_12055 [Blautia sp.]|nr:hypothetical protein [Blautia sp.]
MAAKDFTEKKLEDFNDVFADILNVCLFNGRVRIREDELETGMARSAYNDHKGKIAEQERDTKKFWKNGQFRLAVFGIENQTEEDQEMIFRNFSYDGAEYRDQIRRRESIRRKNKNRMKAMKTEGAGAEGSVKLERVPDFYPVVTIVLFFSEKRWKGPRSIRNYFKEYNDLEAFIPDYSIKVVDVSYLTDEQLEMFRSDFKFVAEYFVSNRKRKEGLIPEFRMTVDQLKHVEEFFELMNAVTDTDWFSEMPEKVNERGGNGKMLTFILDEARAEGEAAGREEGRAAGRVEGEYIGEIKGRIKTLREDLHYSDEKIISKIMSSYDVTRETVEKYLQEVVLPKG